MKEDLPAEIAALEAEMNEPNFWQNKAHAQEVIKEIGRLKDELAGVGKYDRGDAIITIFSGAGGDDAEDFSQILYNMYLKFCARKNFDTYLIHANENDHGGYRNITFEVRGRQAYGTLKNESGVHRLVRVSPFSAKSLRHTSFSLVEVIPKFDKNSEIEVPETDLKIEFTRSSGPGGQNVNKRETAVRIVHLPTNLSVHIDSERSQNANKEKGLDILKGKIYKRLEEARLAKEKGMYISKTADIEWGNQIRSYVFHPYQMVKDHRTGIELRDIDRVLAGDLDELIEAEKGLG